MTGYRLPTETEWRQIAEQAAPHHCGQYNAADPSALHEFPWLTWGDASCDDGYPGLAPAGSLEADALGLYDLLGNVWEWTWDKEYGASSWGNCGHLKESTPRPVGLIEEQRCLIIATWKSLRGGAWSSPPDWVGPEVHRFAEVDMREGVVGFRVVRTAPRAGR